MCNFTQRNEIINHLPLGSEATSAVIQARFASHHLRVSVSRPLHKWRTHSLLQVRPVGLSFPDIPAKCLQILVGTSARSSNVNCRNLDVRHVSFVQDLVGSFLSGPGHTRFLQQRR